MVSLGLTESEHWLKSISDFNPLQFCKFGFYSTHSDSRESNGPSCCYALLICQFAREDTFIFLINFMEEKLKCFRLYANALVNCG
jgi:hypothetical protein